MNERRERCELGDNWLVMAVSLTIFAFLHRDVSQTHVPSWTLGQEQLDRGSGNHMTVT